MKNLKLMLLTLTAIMFLSTENLSAQENNSKHIIIRITETRIGGKPTIVTTDMEGKSKIIELKKGLDESGDNAVLIQKELEKWKTEGYEINGLSNCGLGDNVVLTTIILSKE